MAYTDGMYEVRVARDIDISTIGDKGSWAPGLVPHRVKGVAVIIENDIGAAGIIKLDKRPTYGSDTNRGDGDVAVINLATSHLGGAVVYDLLDPVTVNPGEEVVVDCTDAGAAGDQVEVILLVEPIFEHPSNNSAMVETA